jgi:hypothetical protein
MLIVGFGVEPKGEKASGGGRRLFLSELAQLTSTVLEFVMFGTTDDYMYQIGRESQSGFYLGYGRAQAPRVDCKMLEVSSMGIYISYHQGLLPTSPEFALSMTFLP